MILSMDIKIIGIIDIFTIDYKFVILLRAGKTFLLPKV